MHRSGARLLSVLHNGYIMAESRNTVDDTLR